MKLLILTLFLFLEGKSSSAQISIDEKAIKEVHELIKRRQHAQADSILDYYLNHKQTNDDTFVLHFYKCLNGYCKINTCHDVSVIVPYAESGKIAFEFIRNFVNKENAKDANYWDILVPYAEIFNYLCDSIIIDIADFSSHYYKDYHQHNLYAFYNVLQNTYQYYYHKKEWISAANTMLDYYNTAKRAKDSTIRIPLSAAYIGSAYLQAKHYEKAEKWLNNSYKRFQKHPEKNNFRVYCELLNDISYFYHLQGNDIYAYNFAIESCEANKALFGQNSKEFVKALSILADCEFGINKQEDGIKHMEVIVDLLDTMTNMDDSEKQNYKGKLDLLYLLLNYKHDVTNQDSIITENSIILDAVNSYVKGNIEDAISKFSYLLDLYNKNFIIVDISNYIFVASSLANALISKGNYTEADNVLNHSISLIENNNITSIQIRSLYEAKGLLFYTINNVDMALHWYNLAEDLYGKDEDKKIQYGILLSNLSLCQLAKENYTSAKQLLNIAYQIVLQFYGDNAEDANNRLVILNNVATIYAKMNNYSKSKELYELIIESCTSKQHDNTKALALMNLSEIFLFNESDYCKAEECLLKVKELEATSYVKDMAEVNLCLLHCMTNNQAALAEIAQYNDSIKDGMANVFTHFSETEREDYWTQKSQTLVFLNNLAAISFDNLQTRIMAFDNALYTKNMLIISERLIGNIVKDCHQDTKAAFSSMQKYKTALSSKRTPKDSISSYVDSISLLEKQLLSSIPDFNNRLKKQFKTTADVQAMLSDGDVAIEFVFLPIIKYPLEKSELKYGALILSKGSEGPILIPLCSKDELEELFDVDNSTNQDFVEKMYDVQDKKIYNLLWANIEPYIPEGAAIYYSPTGYISKINLSAISDGNKRLLDKFEIHEVSSTAIIGEVKQREIVDIQNVALYGDINYFEDVNLMADYSAKYNFFSSNSIIATRFLNRNTWDLLPYTKEEISTIGKQMKEKGIQVQTFCQNEANEESFKALNNNAPNIIHVATHGFYFSSDEDITTNYWGSLNSYTKKNYSLLYSGLLFAGANNVWTGKELTDKIEDGILTADEISQINLEGCNLIVLSACNTGLGDIDNVDGVLGLQRAFKKAGVSTILMSLWKVPDEETFIMMNAFYEHLMSGNTAQQSLQYAQGKLIGIGKSPYYWAGFIVLD